MNETRTELKSNQRRDALRKIGKMAAYTAPAMMVMLASKRGNAGRFSQGNNGFGNGGYDGVPGRSGFRMRIAKTC